MAKHIDWYGAAFKAWQAKVSGSKPTEAMIKAAHAFGRPGKQSMALAMAMRPEGVTANQVLMVCGAPQNNHRGKVLKQGYFKRLPMSANDVNHTVYRIELTAKGNGKVAKFEAAPADGADGADKPAKAKAKPAKARKPKPVKAPADAPAPVSDGADSNPPVDGVQA